MVGPSGWGKREETGFCGDRGSVWGDEKVLETDVVMVIQ